MKAGNKSQLYFYSLAVVVAFSAKSFLQYDATGEKIWLIPCIIFAVVFFAICVDVFKWWARVSRGE